MSEPGEWKDPTLEHPIYGNSMPPLPTEERSAYLPEGSVHVAEADSRKMVDETCRHCGGKRMYRVGDAGEAIAIATQEFEHTLDCQDAPLAKHLIQDGWLCPRCDVIVAPFYRRCEYCGPTELAKD